MYIQVALLNGFEKLLWYSVPSHLSEEVLVGTVVQVPLQRRQESALVVHKSLVADVSFKIRPITALSEFPADHVYHTFLQKISSIYFCHSIYFYQRIRHFLTEKDKESPVAQSAFDGGEHAQAESAIVLTDEQQAVVDYVKPFIAHQRYTPTLMHGVTGSGKTEVYKKLIIETIIQNKSVIMLLPEVTLALQFEHLLQQQMPGIRIIGFHSATKIFQKRALWDALVKGEPLLIIGVHLPIMLPLRNLGLIIIDEEHEQGFQEKKHPKLNSKEIALLRAYHYKIPILLGSATPSLISLHNIKRHQWKFFEITRRFSGQFPVVKKVILTQEPMRRRKAFWVSATLEAAIHDRLAKKEQIIIFLNRRGYSFFVQCKSCGFIFECPDCSVSLTLHTSENSTESHVLRCHYCDYRLTFPHMCPSCKASEKELLKKGIGTQQVLQIFKDLFPRAVIERADMDSTSKKRSWQATVNGFKNGSIDMLIGTQTITKGYHFPKVTLVGVLWADLNLHFPVYNAGETTLQQLIQVAGRAGRQSAGGEVIVQAMHDHQIFNYLDEQKYMKFCESELIDRQDASYPPFARLACIELKYSSEEQVDHDAQALVEKLHSFNESNNLEATILGPAFPIVRRIQKYEIRHIIIKSTSFKHIHMLLVYVQKQRFVSSTYIVINP